MPGQYVHARIPERSIMCAVFVAQNAFELEAGTLGHGTAARVLRVSVDFEAPGTTFLQRKGDQPCNSLCDVTLPCAGFAAPVADFQPAGFMSRRCNPVQPMRPLSALEKISMGRSVRALKLRAPFRQKLSESSMFGTSIAHGSEAGHWRSTPSVSTTASCTNAPSPARGARTRSLFVSNWSWVLVIARSTTDFWKTRIERRMKAVGRVMYMAFCLQLHILPSCSSGRLSCWPPCRKKPAGLARGGLPIERYYAQISSDSILMAPQGHSAAQMPQPLQYS